MKITKLLLIFISLLVLGLVVFFVFTQENVAVFQPKGIIAREQLRLILYNLTLMLLILVPTLIWLLAVIWKKKYSIRNQIILWLMPTLVVLIMAQHTWKETYRLDPYKPLGPKEEELLIQVVALDWKWLFLYPEQGIATVNFVQFPEKKAIRFELTADGTPMNSFWIPQLSGQIYCMTGMVTPLHIMADHLGIYKGKAAEINGEGYAKMTFLAQSVTQQEFENWVKKSKQSPLILDSAAYQELLIRSIDHPPTVYSQIEKDIFKRIVMKYTMK